jgi:hypothetical protein
MATSNFKVSVRVRPPVPRELDAPTYSSAIMIDDGRAITLSAAADLESGEDGGAGKAHSFRFDRVYGGEDGQQQVYESAARDAVLSSLQVSRAARRPPSVCRPSARELTTGAAGLQRHGDGVRADGRWQDLHHGG